MKTLILAGGIGTRLFPLSRGLYPKQFIPLFDNESLFQKTVSRALLHSDPEEIFIVTNEKHKFLAKDQTAENCRECTILIEPEGKNTLPAIYFGISCIVNKFGSSNVAIFPSDHLLEPNYSYHKAMMVADRLAATYLVTFGITPTHPHTGYGYIKPGKQIGEGKRVDSFVEKPDTETAQHYIEDGYLWNSGMFLFNSDLFIEECELHSPDVAEAFSHSVKEAFARVKPKSIDYGIMEKTSNAAVVPLNAPWNDLGSFDALYHVMEKDKSGNAIRSEYKGIASSGNLIIGDHLITTIDVHDMAIIDTHDALLVSPRSASQHIRDIVTELKQAGDERTEMHTTVHRPWGSYTVLENRPRFKIKRISVPPGKRLSLQMHHHRSEHWVVVEGTAKVTIGKKEYLVTSGESTFVPAGMKHRLENSGIIPLEIIEVSIGEYISEDDIIRYDDDFERK